MTDHPHASVARPSETAAATVACPERAPISGPDAKHLRALASDLLAHAVQDPQRHSMVAIRATVYEVAQGLLDLLPQNYCADVISGPTMGETGQRANAEPASTHHLDFTERGMP